MPIFAISVICGWSDLDDVKPFVEFAPFIFLGVFLHRQNSLFGVVHDWWP